MIALAIGAFFKKFGAWIVALLSVIGAGLTLWYSSRSVGKAEAATDAQQQRSNDNEALAVRQVNETRDASAVQIKAVTNAKHETDAVNSLDAGAIADSLSKDFIRKD